MGFWYNMEGGIMRRVMQSQADHMSRQSWIEGTPKGVVVVVGAFNSGKLKGGRSSNQRE